MKVFLGIFAAIVMLAFVQPAAAQEPELGLSLSRDFGYGGFNNQIEGLFSVHAKGPADLVRVYFYIDDSLLASVTESPFSFQFSTSSYAPGEHRLHALGLTAAGAELRSNELVRVFLTKEASGRAVVDLIIPLLGGVAAVVALMIATSLLMGRKSRFTGSYGMLGGAVCANCGLPFGLSFLAPRLLVGRLQRCPHCRVWALVRRAQPADLAAAEARWHGTETAPSSRKDAAARSKRQIDDSRYEE